MKKHKSPDVCPTTNLDESMVKIICRKDGFSVRVNNRMDDGLLK